MGTDAKPSRTAYLGTSMLFPISTAVERVQDALEELVVRSVRDGQWQAELLVA